MTDAPHRHSTAEMFTLDDYLHGRPDHILHATKTPRILIVWQHGNEELGPRVAHHIFTSRPDLASHVDYLCGDPHAAATQSPAALLGYDVNRSYAPAQDTSDYAEQRAQDILAFIHAGSYDYVLDLHTSITNLEQFFIVRHELPPATLKTIAASPVTKVVAMPDSIIGKALIGHVPHAIAFECNETFAETPQAIQEIIGTIEVLAGLTEAQPFRREIFYVDSPIPKTKDPGDDAQNFVLCKDGYYPILLGKGKYSYRNDPTKDYVCFGASRKDMRVI